MILHLGHILVAFTTEANARLAGHQPRIDLRLTGIAKPLTIPFPVLLLLARFARWQNMCVATYARLEREKIL